MHSVNKQNEELCSNLKVQNQFKMSNQLKWSSTTVLTSCQRCLCIVLKRNSHGCMKKIKLAAVSRYSLLGWLQDGQILHTKSRLCCSILGFTMLIWLPESIIKKQIRLRLAQTHCSRDGRRGWNVYQGNYNSQFAVSASQLAVCITSQKNRHNSWTPDKYKAQLGWKHTLRCNKTVNSKNVCHCEFLHMTTFNFTTHSD